MSKKDTVEALKESYEIMRKLEGKPEEEKKPSFGIEIVDWKEIKNNKEKDNG